MKREVFSSRTRHAHTTTTLLCVLLSVLSILPLKALQPEPNAVFVRVVDVGPGLCCVIQMPGNRFAIYDAGDGSAANGKIQELIPLGSALELLVLSHSDSDHLGSVPFICKQYMVKNVIHSGLKKPRSKGSSEPTLAWSKAMRAIHSEVVDEHCQEKSLKDSPLTPGQTFTFGDVRLVTVFGLTQPPAAWGFTSSKHTSEFYNSGSIVMRLDYRGKSVLFCGDTVGRLIDDPATTCIAAERAMVDNNSNVSINCDVIVAPHHGADNGSSTAFIQATSPTFVIFSAGTLFKHPRASSAKRYLDNGVAVERMFRTDRGDIQRNGEWTVGTGQGDKAGDDDVDVLIRNSGQIVVDYR